jgi:two-component system CheB/CheR fusion protein
MHTQNDPPPSPGVDPVGGMCPIVGIGASAGGLEAFQEFFANMPQDSGFAFVLVQHLGTGSQDLLSQIMARFTDMHVEVAASDVGTPIEPNRIYILPPGKTATLSGRVLYLSDPEPLSGRNRPIDAFLLSLAEDVGEWAVGIILSGTGSDGSRGVMAIKEHDGLVIAQSPDSATHSGMPQSAINSALIDYVLRPSEMPRFLLNHFQGIASTPTEGTAPVQLPTSIGALQRIFAILRRHVGHDFSLYKQNTVMRRISRRMTVNQIDQLEQYVAFLEHHPQETTILFHELLIGVTRFFRDPEAFDILQEQIIPQIFTDRSPDQPLRIWVPACSTGEEAYSIGIVLIEYMDSQNRAYDVQIFATDIDSLAIEKARTGKYTEHITADVSSERLRHFFLVEDDTYQVNKRLRDMVVFAVQNVTRDPPFSHLDLVSCRNLLIYMGPELQLKVLNLLHYGLRPGGYLLLGTSETASTAAQLFNVIDHQNAIYQKPLAGPSKVQDLELSTGDVVTSEGSRKPPVPINEIRRLAERVLLRRYVPSAVVLNAKGEIYYTLGRTGLFLEPSEGKVSNNIVDMAREGLRYPLSAVLRKVAEQRQEYLTKNVVVRTNGDSHTINLIVTPLDEHDLVMAIFEPADPILPAIQLPPTGADQPGESADERVRQLEQQLSTAREYLQTTIEELETTNEELQSANEELQSSNEELQSANEELETSREEIQSMHEEQMTVNAELRDKVDQMNQANNDLRNLLASIEVGTIFLDLDLRIVRFTPVAREVFSLRDSDIGRALSELVPRIEGDVDPVGRAEQVLETLEASSDEVQNSEGEWYWMRILPYRTTEYAIAGVIMTFSNITRQKADRELLPRLMRVAEKSAGMMLVVDSNQRIDYVNPQVVSLTGYAEDQLVGQSPQLLLADEESKAQFATVWQTALAGEESSGEFRQRRKNGNDFWVSMALAPLHNSKGIVTNIVISAEDISERVRAQADRRRMNRLLAGLGEWLRRAGPDDEREAQIARLCKLLVETGVYRTVWVGLLDPAQPAQLRQVGLAGVVASDSQGAAAPWQTVDQPGSPLHALITGAAPVWQEKDWLGVAIRRQEGIKGVLLARMREPSLFPAGEIEALEIIAAQL